MPSDTFPNFLGAAILITGWEYYKYLLVNGRFLMSLFVWILAVLTGVSLIEMVVE